MSSSSTFSMSPEEASSCWSIMYGVRCTTSTSSPRFISPRAASSPSNPPPITVALPASAAYSTISVQSSSVRNGNMPSRKAPSSLYSPSIIGMNGELPVAITSLSYGTRSPPAPYAVFDLRSMPMTRTPACSVMSFSSYHDSGLMNMSFGSWVPASTPESRMRL